MPGIQWRIKAHLRRQLHRFGAHRGAATSPPESLRFPALPPAAAALVVERGGGSSRIHTRLGCERGPLLTKCPPNPRFPMTGSRNVRLTDLRAIDTSCRSWEASPLGRADPRLRGGPTRQPGCLQVSRQPTAARSRSPKSAVTRRGEDPRSPRSVRSVRSVRSDRSSGKPAGGKPALAGRELRLAPGRGKRTRRWAGEAPVLSGGYAGAHRRQSSSGAVGGRRAEGRTADVEWGRRGDRIPPARRGARGRSSSNTEPVRTQPHPLKRSTRSATGAPAEPASWANDLTDLAPPCKGVHLHIRERGADRLAHHPSSMGPGPDPADQGPY
jgi:hypothetical protein